MCGFAGFLSSSSLESVSATQEVLASMAAAIRHRGPDSEGIWTDGLEGIALGHRRLAIVDLSPAGAQPMHSASGRYVITYNGEIYNHQSLRDRLTRNGASPAWRGQSDTETLLACFDEWGIENSIEQCTGMFSFAVWDRSTASLTLGRDRLGEKPVYYGWQGAGRSTVFLFGSELKALRAHPQFNAPISREALCLYLRHSNVPGHHSIYEGIYKLPPAGLLTISRSRPQASPRMYWSGAAIASSGASLPIVLGDNELVDKLEDVLSTAVRAQMVADVPLGAFLSGGIDSSVIVSLMQAQSPRPIRTFSIGFNETDYSEAHYARAVAKHLGTQHIELYVTPEQAMAVIAQLPEIYDEPFADSSQIPTFLVSQLARQHVTVSLSGDGGDELFGGYNRYLLTTALWPRIRSLPLRVRNSIAFLLTRLSPATLSTLSQLLPGKRRWHNVGEKLHKGSAVLGSSSLTELYCNLTSAWPDPSILLAGNTNTTCDTTEFSQGLGNLTNAEMMMAMDMLSYLPDDVLCKLDRAAMATSLETRAPFLDHKVVEFAWQLPMHSKIRRENERLVSKWVLRQVLYKHVPRSLVDRPKMGFSVPIDDWLRGPLRSWAEELLDARRLEREGFFNVPTIRQKWDEHLSGRRNWHTQLWTVLMFQAWLQYQNAPND